MKHMHKYQILLDCGDRLTERVIPAKNERQAAERCQHGENRIISIRLYTGRMELDKPDMMCFTSKKM